MPLGLGPKARPISEYGLSESDQNSLLSLLLPVSTSEVG